MKYAGWFLFAFVIAIIVLDLYIKYKIWTADDINEWIKFWLVFGK